LPHITLSLETGPCEFLLTDDVYSDSCHFLKMEDETSPSIRLG
jgi:hypothetical protein